MSLIDERELLELERRYDELSRWHRVLEIGERGAEFWRRALTSDRRGEVVMVILNDANDCLLHTKPKYPPGTYRLMTGGVKYSETVEEALEREIMEETGLRTDLERCLGLVEYSLQYQRETFEFVSYVFTTRYTGGEPQPQDPDEIIDGYKWVSLDELPKITAHLYSLEEEPDWGRFRAIAHDFVIDWWRGEL